MSYHFDPWLGLGAALFDANERFRTTLMPGPLANAAALLAQEYAAHPELHTHFERRMEHWLDIEIGILTEAESHAAKHVLGRIFAENAANRRVLEAAAAAEEAALSQRSGPIR